MAFRSILGDTGAACNLMQRGKMGMGVHGEGVSFKRPTVQQGAGETTSVLLRV